MKLSKFIIVTISAVIVLVLPSCVTTKKYNLMKSEREQCEQDRLYQASENQKYAILTKEQNTKLEQYRKDNEALKQDTLSIGTNYRTTKETLENRNLEYNELLDKYNDTQSKSQIEVSRVLSELNKSKADLIKKEDSLANLQTELSSKLHNVDDLKNKLDEKEMAYQQLEKEIKTKDSIMNSLKNKVTEALVGFEKEGLTISQKGGRVYVSMEEKLLFPSGSFTLNPRGKEAIQQLGTVLENNQDINITVEGHTDSIPYKGGANIDDNWDLSTKRATTIVRILKQNPKISPLRITASGRGEYFPIQSNSTREGRAKNRRTEIILMPDLDKLYQIIQ